MKNILLIFSIIGLSGCDSVECVEYYVDNSSSSDIIINFYNSGESLISLPVSSGQKSTLLENCEKGGAGLSLEFYDSIIAYENQVSVINYYPSANIRNNIFELENGEIWVRENVDDDLTKYTYTISEKDMK